MDASRNGYPLTIDRFNQLFAFMRAGACESPARPAWCEAVDEHSGKKLHPLRNERIFSFRGEEHPFRHGLNLQTASCSGHLSRQFRSSKRSGEPDAPPVAGISTNLELGPDGLSLNDASAGPIAGVPR
jgi:hypothetical protein